MKDHIYFDYDFIFNRYELITIRKLRFKQNTSYWSNIKLINK